MQTKEYLKLVEDKCIEIVLNEYNEKNDLEYQNLEVIQVWYCKTIQNHKGLFIIKNKKDGMILPHFIEATYNGNKDQLYLDFYKKSHKFSVGSCFRLIEEFE